MSSLSEPRLFIQIAYTRWFISSSKIQLSSLKICHRSSNRSCRDCSTRLQASALPGQSSYHIHSLTKQNKRRKIERLGMNSILTGLPTNTTQAANRTCRRCLKPTIHRVLTRIKKSCLKSLMMSACPVSNHASTLCLMMRIHSDHRGSRMKFGRNSRIRAKMRLDALLLDMTLTCWTRLSRCWSIRQLNWALR